MDKHYVNFLSLVKERIRQAQYDGLKRSIRSLLRFIGTLAG
jgi:hypothetical protein